MAAKEKAPDGMALINSHINNSSFRQIYLFGGTEQYLVKQYRDKLVSAVIDPGDTMNLEVFKGENVKVNAIASSLSTLPFFSERRVLLVEDSDFFKKGNEELETALQDIPESNIIIFMEKNIDKRTKLYKTVDKLGTVASFDAPDTQTLMRWIAGLFAEDEIMVERSALQVLLEGVGSDMNTLYHEVEKLKDYCFETKQVTAKDVENLCISQVEGKIFDMMDALSRKDKKTTMSLYDDLLSLREPSMRILYLITRQFNILLKVKFARENGTPDHSLASALKIPPFAVKKYISQTNSYSYKELLACVNRCQQADSDIKTGRMRDGMAVEMLIIELLMK